VSDGHSSKFLTPRSRLAFSGVADKPHGAHWNVRRAHQLFIFATWIFYGLALSPYCRLRKTEPNMDRPYRCPGYPIVLESSSPARSLLPSASLFQNPAAPRSASSSFFRLAFLRYGSANHHCMTELPEPRIAFVRPPWSLTIRSPWLASCYVVVTCARRAMQRWDPGSSPCSYFQFLAMWHSLTSFKLRAGWR